MLESTLSQSLAWRLKALRPSERLGRATESEAAGAQCRGGCGGRAALVQHHGRAVAHVARGDHQGGGGRKAIALEGGHGALHFDRGCRTAAN